jgi:hypothetical protein
MQSRYIPPSRDIAIIRKNNKPTQSPTSGYELPYDASVWNSSKVIERHNCYDYARDNLDMIQVSKSQPGERNNDIGYAPYTCSALEKRIREDNPHLYTVGYDVPCKKGFRKISMLVSDDAEDFHFLRHDKDGTWSQKVGELEAKRTDSAGRIITDPRFASLKTDEREYVELCNFYCLG